MRVVSLCPSLTESVFELGRGSTLVGRTRFCVAPEAASRVEVVGGTKDPEVERIVGLAPDLVLMNVEENRREDAESLEARGLTVHASLPRGPADVPALLRELGARLGADAEAERVAQRLERQLDEAVRTAPSSRVGFAYLIWRGPWMAAGPDTYASALLEACGGRNVLGAGADRYPTLELERLAELAPERVLLTSEPYRFRSRHVAEVAAGSGLHPDCVRLVDGQALTWHGTRTCVGLREARRALSG